jgi:hypothetical protein
VSQSRKVARSVRANRPSPSAFGLGVSVAARRTRRSHRPAVLLVRGTAT